MPPAVGGPVGYTPPEGGWGWAVVAGAFISIGFSYAFPKSITVFFKEIEAIFEATPSQVSWISSIMLAVMYAGVGGGCNIEAHPAPAPNMAAHQRRGFLCQGGQTLSQGGQHRARVSRERSGLIAASFCNTVEQLYFFIGVHRHGGPALCSLSHAGSSQLLALMSSGGGAASSSWDSCSALLRGGSSSPLGTKLQPAKADTEGGGRPRRNWIQCNPQLRVLQTINSFIDLALFQTPRLPIAS
ncbi:AQY56584.1 clathrin light chain [Lates japonicus]|uniref:Monocarboxylate transporter 1 n=1 Tax=Lates japonicus TaxID=270547 RepID=A0AAD3M9W9_LATJO|nr:AQY56584.1 clathrin light chain [Lates japonicus]